MVKIADFIVEKRKFILILFSVLTLLSIYLTTKVTVNYDMTKYLPKASSTKAGLEVMDSEFPAANSVHVMFKGLSENEKSEIYNELSEMKGIVSVSYEAGSDKYNNGDYTLYTISMSCGAYSAEAKAVVADIEERYSGYDITMSGEAAGMKDLGYIFIPAVAILLIILFLMSKSWFEPLILVGNIGVAILINMGTNVIFSSISEITQTIAAILQLVLSMDYSIMLINRYRQEKELTSDKYDAMKKALKGAFVAISSSSVTTIVGMFMLVFMSFTIGMDLGLVIAKGVFFSLLCVFTIMPAFVLMADKIIEKTAKPSLNFKMNRTASFLYSARYIMIVVFLVLFVAGFSLRNSTSINYSMTEYDDVYQIFTIDNPIVILYENKDEKNIAGLVDNWSNHDFVDSINTYSTTLGKELAASEFVYAVGMDESMVDLLFYYYFNDKSIPDGQAVQIDDFLDFISDDIASNEMFSAYFTEEVLAQLDMFAIFTDKNTINAPLDAGTLSMMVGIDAAAIEQIFFMLSGGTGSIQTMSIYDFVGFIVNTLSADPDFAGTFDQTALQQLGLLYFIMDAVQTDKAFTPAELSALFGSGSGMADEGMLDLLFLFYYSRQESNPDWKLSVYDFMSFIVNDIAADERFSAFLPYDSIKMLSESMVEMDNGIKQLVGSHFSRIIISTTLSEESDETFDFIADLDDKLNNTLGGEYYIIGNSAMAYEMAGDFPSELSFITILTAISIFIVVMIAFRSLSIPLILVCVIQSAVFIMMGTAYIQGSSIYYLALLIVQCLMMGATIDYGLLYTSNYLEARSSEDIKKSIVTALNHTMHTVMTSGLILITITLVLGLLFASSSYAVSEILLIIARGCFCAIIMVVFILPGLLAALDRYVVKKKKNK